MPGVWTFAGLVAEQIDPAETGEPSTCGWCGGFVIFTDELTLRQMDWPDWCLLTYTKKKNLVATRAVALARIRAARQ